jgi:hypothetical protein
MTTARDTFFRDIFTTALEGGINYWAQVHAYHIWQAGTAEQTEPGLVADYAGFYAVVTDEADQRFETSHRISRTTIVQGYRLATSAHWRGRIAWSAGKPPVVLTGDIDWDFDASDADVIVQLGLFGDVVYG